MPFDIAPALELLGRTPGTLAALLRGLDASWTSAREAPDSFSPFDVVGHLIDGEETDWVPRAALILAGNPDAEFAPYDRFRHRTRNAGRSLDELLTEFADLRAANLARVRTWKLSPEQLALRARHPSFGVVSLQQLLATWVAHDLGHLAQISRVMAKQYRDDVGPWAAFLPVLTDRSSTPT